MDAYQSLLNQHGRPLHAIGVHGSGLAREHAVEAIRCLSTLGVAVLGGDVYRFVGDRPEPTLDNWYCDRAEGETFAEFQRRSTKVATQYVNDYPDPGEGIVFDLVVSAD
jgi:hypothetical protein